MSRESYNVGNVFIPEVECDERFSSGNPKKIVIGGDKGDVHAASAFNSRSFDETCEGVMLEDVTLFTTLKLTDEEAYDIVMEVVSESWASIQSDTFNQTVRTD